MKCYRCNKTIKAGKHGAVVLTVITKKGVHPGHMWGKGSAHGNIDLCRECAWLLDDVATVAIAQELNGGKR